MNEDKCVMCGTVVPEGTQVCPICARRVEGEPITLEFVCKILADLFDYPCDISTSQEFMHNTDTGLEWCEKNCNKMTAAECWEHYFRLKFAERRTESNG